jgi:DNA-binding transcriptional LysR family regulator
MLARMLVFMESARVHSAQRGYRGQLRIGLADHQAQPSLTRLLTRCREEELQTEIRIHEMIVGEMVKALNYDQIDAGFTVHPEPANLGQRLCNEVVWRDRFAVVLPRIIRCFRMAAVPVAQAKLMQGIGQIVHQGFHRLSVM